jgi:hypothetical protein
MYLPMKHTLCPAVLWSLVAGLTSQQVATPIAVAPLGEIRRVIPEGLGSGSALRVLRFDPDGDHLNDLAILWSSGEVVFSYAPEVLPAFVVCPGTGVTGLAVVPGAASLPIAGGDCLLEANGTSLAFVVFDPEVARSGISNGFQLLPVIAPEAWQHVVRVETRLVGTTCWLLGLASDGRTLRIGAIGPSGIAEVGAAVATGTVHQMQFADHEGQLLVSARTQSGLEVFTLDGVVASATIAAATPTALGGMTMLNDGGTRRLAWLTLAGSSWRLQIYQDSLLQQDSMISAPAYVPNRFRATGLGAMAVDGSTDALVIAQDSTEWQIVLMKGDDGAYAPSCAFQSSDTTYLVDECEALLDDMNNDNSADFTTVLTSARAVQIERGLPGAVNHALGRGPLPIDTPDFLTDTVCSMTDSTPGVHIDDEIDLHFEVPAEYGSMPNLLAQIVAWPQTVLSPGSAPYLAGPMDQAKVNVVFDLTADGSLSDRPVLPLVLPVDNGGIWSPQNIWFFMVRLIQRDSNNKITWSSPAQMVGFMAQNGTGQLPTAYLDSISSPSGHGQVAVQGGNRNVGVIKKPDHIDPPNSTLTVPVPPPAGPARLPAGSW